MPTHFEFQDDDEYVRSVLDEEARAEVVTWQSARLDYQFSFHTQHEGGWPCYLKEPDGPNRNLPKINVKEESYTGALLQGSSVKDNHVGTDFKRVIIANIEKFRLLAERYYEGEDEDEDEVEIHRPPVWIVSFTCGQGRAPHQGREQRVRLPTGVQGIATGFWANFGRWAEIPDCTLHRNKDCMTGQAIAVNDLDAEDVQKIYNRNGEIGDV